MHKKIDQYIQQHYFNMMDNKITFEEFDFTYKEILNKYINLDPQNCYIEQLIIKDISLLKGILDKFKAKRKIKN